ncbi:hypothetical protein NDU88_002234 [Pleurodeles waltl]|uniref:Uncharacterized protein n=1 Tax=Pleurodeles waltl TaxID=8319 RepID=A0AAV7UVJ7_PLEWA|nr:hypothetical protein NDU88_002234 [Pleurodeles waltl]
MPFLKGLLVYAIQFLQAGPRCPRTDSATVISFQEHSNAQYILILDFHEMPKEMIEKCLDLATQDLLLHSSKQLFDNLKQVVRPRKTEQRAMHANKSIKTLLTFVSFGNWDKNCIT